MAAAQYICLSAISRDPLVAAAFARIERDASGALVLPRRPEPVLPNGAVVRVLEAA